MIESESRRETGIQPTWLRAIVAVVTLAVLGAGIYAWHIHATRLQEEQSYQSAEQLIASNRATEALAIIEKQSQSARSQSPAVRARWLALEIAAREQMGQVPWLMAVYSQSPESFAGQERAVLRIGRALVRAGDLNAFSKLRESWRARGANEAGWFNVDVDALLRAGKRDAAVQMLNSRSFPGAADCGRLARLALLTAPDNLKAAWDYLDRAAALDANSAEVRLFRAEILESVGRREPARAEYAAALRADPNDAFIRDQLAEFHRRGGSYDLAVWTWAEGLTNRAATDLLWLKTIFWARTTRAVRFDWNTPKPETGELMPLVSYLLSLPAGRYWNAAEFAKIPEARRYEQDRQEVFWFELLGKLQDGEEDQALPLLQTNRFRGDSWNLELESALLRVLNYRRGGGLAFPAGVTLPLNEAPPKSRHHFLEQLDDCTRNPGEKPAPELEALLRSKEAFAAVCLAVGWPEAALNLARTDVVPDGFPEWVAFGLTQARRFNRGNAEALAFAAKQKPTPTLDYLTGEILIADKQFGPGILKLMDVAKGDTDVAVHAAWFIAQTYAGLKQYDQARTAVENQPRLKQSVTGKELLARLALAQGDAAQGQQIYTEIESESDEAKAYLAGLAFQQKDWPRARVLTQELVRKHPDQVQFQANLDAIAKAETDQSDASGKSEVPK